MAWNSTRPVPWSRLMREWVVYALIMSAIFMLFFRDRNLIGVLAGLLVSGPLYLLLGAVLAKFGYQRKTIKQMRQEARTPAAERRSETETDGPRPKPPPTRRTSSGPSNRPRSGSRRRR